MKKKVDVTHPHIHGARRERSTHIYIYINVIDVLETSTGVVASCTPVMREVM